MAEAPKKKGLGIPVEVARQQLLENADTQQIARDLGMDLEEYVGMILDYAQNPEKEPILQVLDDETLASLGAEVPTQAEVMDWLKAVERGEIDLTVQADVISDEVELKSAEEERKKKLKAAIGANASSAAPNVARPPKPAVSKADPAAGSVLKQQLLAQRSMANQKAPTKPQTTQPKPKGSR